MRKELDDLLCEKYPKIFAERNMPMNLTCMCWGFQHNGGWFNIIDTLCNSIQWYLDQEWNLPKEIPQVVAKQVKEKFGTLRFDYSGGDDHIWGMVRMAESMSAVTCEICGSPGKRRDGAWISTLCDIHAKQNLNKI